MQSTLSRASILAALVAAASVCPLQATLLVSESFSGYSAGNINGQAASGTGLTGSYTSTAAGLSYTTSGLNFANIASSGGALNISTTTAINAGVQLNAGTVTGDLFTSYLYSKPGSFSSGTDSLVETRVNSTVNGLGSASHFRAQVNTDNSGSNNAGIGYDLTPTSASTALTVNSATYLVIAKYTNVGVTLDVGTPGTASLWIMTEAQYTNLTTIGVTEANLNNLTIGSAAGNVMVRATDANVTSGTFSFTNGDFLQFAATGSVSTQSGVFDELRFGTTLADVTPAPVPEPGAVLPAIAGLALSGLLLRRRARA